MNTEQAAELIWSEAQEGRWFPEALRNRLSLDEALRVQLALMALKEAHGAKQAGWKVGLTSERVRRSYGTDTRPFGHIMTKDVYPSGASIVSAAFSHATLEPELCFTMGETLRGPGVTPEQVRPAVSAVSPAFELNQNRSGGQADFSLAVADNLSQWGIVVGLGLEPIPAGFDFAAMEVSFRRGLRRLETAIGGEVIDDHFLSLSILANTLAEYGLDLQAGMSVITGSFSKHEVKAGERWAAGFSGIGEVSVRFQ